MERKLYGLCIVALVQISHTAANSAVGAVGIEAASYSPVCEALKGVVDYAPVPALGPDFSGSDDDVFRVKAPSGVLYASRSRELELSPEGATVQIAYDLDENEDLQLTLCFTLPQVDGAYAGPIASQGGQHPFVAEFFMANADADAAPELIFLVAWKVSNALGTSGTLFESYIFAAPEGAGVIKRIELQDPALSFGFDGVREGEQVHYPFKDVQVFRARLRELGY